ncbi:MAG TPA: glycosyltransferase family 39 protein [Pseudolabrys sp.]
MRFSPIKFIRRLPAWFRSVLIDRESADVAVLWSLTVYVIVWTAYGTIAKGGQGLHPDMTEIVAWSRDLALGYLKHPPLAAWIVRGWFDAFPLTEWSYYLLAMLMPAVTLWIVWRLAADYLDIEKRVVGLALLTFVPFFNFHALKFNVNTVLMPFWAATTWWFLRSVRRQSALYGALAGAAAGLAMLGKYWSVFLLVGLVVAALIDKRRAAYFRSAAPWVTILVGLAVISPHIYWLVQNHFAPFTYALNIHGEKPFGGTLLSVAGYLGGSVAYVAVPLIIVLVMARPRPATLADMAWPAETDRRLAAASFWLPLLLPALGAVIGKTEITSLWSMACWTLLGVLLLSPQAVNVRAIDTQRIVVAAMIVPFVMLAASPGIDYLIARNEPPPLSAQFPLLAQQVEMLWHQTTPAPLRFVGGDADLAYGVVTYAPDRPRALTNLPQPSAAEFAQAGAVYVCFSEDKACQSEAQKHAAGVPGSQTVASDITRAVRGRLGKPQRYTIVIVPPKSIIITVPPKG